jgi:hypothetical protein
VGPTDTILTRNKTFQPAYCHDIDLMADLMIEYSDIPDWSWKAWNAIEELLSLSYRTRIWIVQEFVLARRVTIHCGSHFIEWKTFERALSHVLQFKVDSYLRTSWPSQRCSKQRNCC